MESPKVVIGRLINDRLTFRPVTISKNAQWIKWLDSEELMEFATDLLKLVDQITKSKKSVSDLDLFLSEWQETALINREEGVLDDIREAELELNSGGGKEWSAIKKEIGF
ncbi:MAG: hypothetical protein QG641_1879 [Candidatus Poribacteria bacterium]|nr:hypothetical protein [Candidatus Poribacteria bacterium]